jgi:hypothetical protein
MTDQLTIKLSTDADRQRIGRLAQLDSRPAPHGEVLLAEINGRLVAAVGMDGSAVADPFERTTAVVRLLRRQLDGKPRPSARGRLLARLVAA